MSDIKVLHLIDSLGLGGAQTMVKGIFEYQKNNKDIFLISLRKRDVKTIINHNNVFEIESTFKYSLVPLLKIIRLIRKNDIKIIHAHLLRSNFFAIFIKIFFLGKVKVIVHEHGGILLGEKFYKLFIKFFGKIVDLYIAISKNTERGLLESGVLKSQVCIINNYVRDIFFNNKKEKNNIYLVIGFVGRIVKIKGYQDFIESAKRIIEKYSNVKFLIAGIGDNDNLKELMSGYEDRIHYLGYSDTIEEVYSSLDILIMPSHKESQGLVQLEAQASGVAVTASNIDGLNEVVNDGVDCLLFKVGDVDDIFLKTISLIEDSNLRNKISENGILNAKRYNIKNYLNNLQDIYEKLVGKK